MEEVVQQLFPGLDNYHKVGRFLKVGGIKKGELANIETTDIERSYALILEEFKELQEAMDAFKAVRTLKTTADVADALIDIEYVINNMHYELGLPAMALFNEVHSANLRKIVPCTICEINRNTGCDVCNFTGYVVNRSPAGKILKPEGWQGPNNERVLYMEYKASVERVARQDAAGITYPKEHMKGEE